MNMLSFVVLICCVWWQTVVLEQIPLKQSHPYRSGFTIEPCKGSCPSPSSSAVGWISSSNRVHMEIPLLKMTGTKSSEVIFRRIEGSGFRRRGGIKRRKPRSLTNNVATVFEDIEQPSKKIPMPKPMISLLRIATFQRTKNETSTPKLQGNATAFAKATSKDKKATANAVSKHGGIVISQASVKRRGNATATAFSFGARKNSTSWSLATARSSKGGAVKASAGSDTYVDMDSGMEVISDEAEVKRVVERDFGVVQEATRNANRIPT